MLVSGSLELTFVEGLLTIFFATPFFAIRFLTAFFLAGAALGSSSSESSVSSSPCEIIECVPVISSKIFLTLDISDVKD